MNNTTITFAATSPLSTGSVSGYYVSDTVSNVTFSQPENKKSRKFRPQIKAENERIKKGVIGLSGKIVQLRQHDKVVTILCVKESIKNLFGVELDFVELRMKRFPISLVEENHYKVQDQWIDEAELEYFGHKVVEFATSLNITDQNIILASGILSLVSSSFSGFKKLNLTEMLLKSDNKRVKLPDSVKKAVAGNFCREYQRKSIPVLENMFAELLNIIKDTNENGKLPEKYQNLTMLGHKEENNLLIGEQNENNTSA